MPSPQFVLKDRTVDSGVTNVRKVKPPHWRRWLGPANRCPSPASDTTAEGKKAPVRFAADDSRSLMAFAGIWTNWTSARKNKEGEVNADLYAFLTCEPNGVVAPNHPEAMPVILTNPRRWTSGCGRNERSRRRRSGYCRTMRCRPLHVESGRTVSSSYAA